MAEYSVFFLLAYAYFLLNYFLPNGFFYWLFWKRNRESWADQRIQKDREPSPDQIRTEIASSLRSLAWYAAIATFAMWCYRHGYSSMSTSAVPSGRHFLSLVLLMLAHDTYFYWVHRLLHVRPIFRLIHRHHHDSLAPTPWAAYSLSTGEAILQCPLWVLCFTVPAHPAIVLTVLFLQNIYDTFGHLGYEFFPGWMLRSKWILAVQATPTHHDTHHRYFQGNFGHYFNLWDRLMRTELPQYSHLYDGAHDAAPSSRPTTARPLPTVRSTSPKQVGQRSRAIAAIAAKSPEHSLAPL
jgi:sterol desaturase/sphingolipid hydroxylase (fatty acid hydroxylase superfamily)